MAFFFPSLLVFLPIIFDSSMSDENIHQDTSKAASELNKLKSLRPELGPFAFVRGLND